MVPEQLVAKLAQQFWDDVNRYVPLVLHGGCEPEPCPEAAPRPIGEFIVAQEVDDQDQFLLPEPLLGPVDGRHLQILVIGANPRYDPEAGDDTRMSACSLQRYIEIHNERLFMRDHDHQIARSASGRLVPIAHINWVERNVLEPALGERAFGRNAVYADAIPWAWRPSSRRRPRLRDVAVRDYARERVTQILQELRPVVVVTLGTIAADAMGGRLPSRSGEQLAAREATVGAWQGRHVAAHHPDAPHLTSATERATYAETLSHILRDAVA